MRDFIDIIHTFMRDIIMNIYIFMRDMTDYCFCCLDKIKGWLLK